ncbi:MAG: redoxin domain-containing protein [Kiritimatiellia bacterium]
MIIGSPARNSGDLDVGDELVAVAEAGGERQPLDHTPVERALELLSGPPGSEVVVFVHSGIGESRAVKLTRAKLAPGADNADLLLLEEGTVAPDFEFTDLGSGRTNRFSAVRGEPVMLVFWATWDPHSRAAMATLQRSLPEYDPAARQRILTVSIDHTMEAAADYVAGRTGMGSATPGPGARPNATASASCPKPSSSTPPA